MRYTILTKGDSKSNALKHKMINHMKDFQMVEDSENPEIVISVGGDGTLLQAFHQYSHMLSKVAFVGIHTGHLGFYEVMDTANGLFSKHRWYGNLSVQRY